jgi:hypothetical protein
MTFEQFCKEQGEWSQATFGLDTERGPKGPLLHLLKEAQEAIDALDDPEQDAPMEIVDCFFLVIDASRRFGMTPEDLMALATMKLHINRSRKWQKPANQDQAIEHVREANHG